MFDIPSKDCLRPSTQSQNVFDKRILLICTNPLRELNQFQNYSRLRM